MSDISSLIKCRGQLKAAVKRFLNFVTKENVDVNEIYIRKEKIEETWSEYERIQSEIEETEGVEMDEQDKYREEFEEMFFKAVGIAKKLTEPVFNEKKKATTDIKDSGRKISRPPIRLSALNVPTFSGEYNEWATFHDIFASLIHNNEDLPPVEKFFYLRSAVTGDAQNCIRCIETTSSNYEMAWNKLKKRYSNKKVLVQTHVKAMFELEPVTSKSSAKLRQFTDALTGHMSALETLGHTPNSWGPLLVHLIVTKLDRNSRREWETITAKEEVAPVEVLIEFLESRFKILEAIETCKNINIRQGAYKFNNHNKQLNEKSSSLVIGNNKGCYICQAPHTIYKCPIFIALPVTERIKRVAEMKLCKVCLRQHVPKKCNGKNCFTCSKPHNTMLHLGNSSELRKSEAEKLSEDQEATAAVSVHVAASSSDQVLLSTAEVRVQNESGESQIGRVLLDSGSQCNFITESMAQILKLKKTRVQHTVLGIGGKSQNVKAAVVVTIRSRINNYNLTCSCLVVPKITNILPSENIGGECIVPSDIELADTSFKIPKKIDLLLGACHFFEILGKQKIKPTINGPIFQETQLGWIVSGLVTSKYTNGKPNNVNCHTALVEENRSTNLEIMVSKFWRTEEFEAAVPYTTEEKKCVDHFERTVNRNENVPASFLATACLRKISELESSYVKACEAIRNDFYMDDFLSGAETKEEAIKLRDEVILIMKKAGMTLRKWSSNEPSIVSCMSEKENANECIFEEESITKILGLYWNADGDVLQYKVKEYHDENTTISKRHILAETAAIFDPMGLVGPIIVQAKLIIQSLWQIRISWDEPLPDNIRIEWVKYRKGLSMLNKLTIPRNIGCNKILTNIQIHGFADASIKCYGACIFLRSTNEQGEHTAKLICAKSKVAPLKVISLPRLELCAALLLARLVSRIVPKLKLNIAKKYFWSDSKIVLSWIASPSTKWKTFVAHRIGEIQDLSNITDWAYVKSSENPADIISRGCDAEQISSINLWWNGPEWLKNNIEEWPITEKTSQNDNIEMLPEAKTIRNIALVVTDEFILFKRYSSLNKILLGPLRAEDLERANIDDKDILRVGGRLKNASTIEVFQRQPIILPGDSIYTKLLFQREHIRCMHGGPLAILALVRLYYWPLKARNIARATVHKCVTCFRQKPVFVEPIMGDLPRERIEPSRPFKISGIDFAGPLLIKDSLKKRASLTKGYVCIFVCFATKAVHIELVIDLSTKSFLNALNRFFDRREWRFIPPRSPHFGGLWEASVKSMKNLIGRVLSESHLTYEELNTILTRVEACLNSRPLTEMSSDPSDLTYLTPAHFLIGESLMAIPERDESTIPANRLDRWRRVRQYTQILWKRWSNEYLNQLQVRKKWSVERGPTLAIGTIVLMRDENIKPLNWKLGRVLSVSHGEDGVIRTALVKTMTGEYNRAVRNLCPLPFDDNVG
ncbi:unnamed protein product [Macrosiphum euphorbiae]|uniref:DUF5641 domain-containing protein n=2 Tax=Macrosiphum euphorbiae TaxID=13131 RepID=A0AAV0Y4I4_9HEMI|nr:unnamed protein product [Macrosiphum euphorbiae]